LNSRRNARRAIVAILLLGLVAVVVWLYASGKFDSGAGKTNTAPAAGPQRVSVVNGVTVVTLGTATQTQSGIRTEPLSSSTYRTETTAYGTVLDLQPLIDFRARYGTAMADAEAARATAAASGQEAERSRILYEDNQNVSLKAYQAAQATFRADQAKAEAAARNAQNVRSAGLQQFGETLVRWALDPNSPEFARLSSRRETLLRVTVPLGDSQTAPTRIDVASNSNQRLPAYWVSPSAQSDPAVQGNAFIYRTSAPLAVGTNVIAYLPTSSQTTQGVVIPANAIVWYGGQPWTYVRMGANRFGRYPVPEQFPMNGGFFANRGFRSGEQIVTGGAQLLLSEELRPQAGSSACKDPECD
jgi:hypothetical protein